MAGSSYRGIPQNGRVNALPNVQLLDREDARHTRYRHLQLLGSTGEEWLLIDGKSDLDAVPPVGP